MHFQAKYFRQIINGKGGNMVLGSDVIIDNPSNPKMIARLQVRNMRVTVNHQKATMQMELYRHDQPVESYNANIVAPVKPTYEISEEEIEEPEIELQPTIYESGYGSVSRDDIHTDSGKAVFSATISGGPTTGGYASGWYIEFVHEDKSKPGIHVSWSVHWVGKGEPNWSALYQELINRGISPAAARVIVQQESMRYQMTKRSLARVRAEFYQHLAELRMAGAKLEAEVNREIQYMLGIMYSW